MPLQSESDSSDDRDEEASAVPIPSESDLNVSGKELESLNLGPSHLDSNQLNSLGVESQTNSKETDKSTSKNLSKDTSKDTSKEVGEKGVDNKDPDMITIRFKPIGSTLPINPVIFKISCTQTVSTIVKFLCKKLKVTHIYIYVLNSFSPNPDENLGELFKSFQVNNELIINYCNSIAFG